MSLPFARGAPFHRGSIPRRGKSSAASFVNKRKRASYTTTPNTIPLGFSRTTVSTPGTVTPHRTLPALKNLNVRSKDQNGLYAEVFKQIMDDEQILVPEEDLDLSSHSHPSPRHIYSHVPQDAPPAKHHAPAPPAINQEHFENLFAPRYGVSRRNLRYLSHIDSDEESNPAVQVNHLLIGQPTTSAKPDNILYPFSIQQPEEGEADGGDVHYGHHTTLFVSEAGCDIPMPRPGQAQMPSISLDSDLPASAVEHPTRVWNTLLHALDPSLQPLIKWQYEEFGDESDPIWVAQVTVILSPTHPAVASHPLFYVLPKNRYSSEYITAIEAIGGIKSWVGEPRKLKTDAMNSALLSCIADHAIAWIHRPVMPPVPTLEDEFMDEPGEQKDIRYRSEPEDVAPSQPPAPAFESPTYQDKGPERIDWIQQLAHFCAVSGFPEPRFSQNVHRRHNESSLFFGVVVVDGQEFVAELPHNNIKAARQEVSREVFVDTFGQEPVEL